MTFNYGRERGCGHHIRYSFSMSMNSWMLTPVQFLFPPIQIAYFTGLRLGEVAGLTWQEINLEEQCLIIRRSIRYNGATHKHEIASTKRKKVRIVVLETPSLTSWKRQVNSSLKTVCGIANSTTGISIGKSQRRTGYIMSIIT